LFVTGGQEPKLSQNISFVQSVTEAQDIDVDAYEQPFWQPQVVDPLPRPASHCSAPATIPSAQAVLHTDGVPVQIQPVSNWQTVEQPSPGLVPPSSHSSPKSMVPFPHNALSTLTVAVAVSLFSVAVIVTAAGPAEMLVAVKAAYVAKAGTITDAGTVTAPVLELESITVVSLTVADASAAFSVAVCWATTSTEAGLRPMLGRVAAIVYVFALLPFSAVTTISMSVWPTKMATVWVTPDTTVVPLIVIVALALPVEAVTPVEMVKTVTSLM
jgi:hypothetical protein